MTSNQTPDDPPMPEPEPGYTRPPEQRLANYGQQPMQPQQYHNGLGTAGFVLGLVATVFAVIPVIGVIAWPLSIVGVVLSAVGLRWVNTGKANNKGLAIAGLTLSIIALALCIIWVAAVNQAADNVPSIPSPEPIPSVIIPSP